MSDGESPDDTGYELDRQQTRTREHRREQADRQWRKNPVSTFRKSQSGEITERDLIHKMGNIQQFESFLLEEIAPKYDGPYEIQGVRDAVEQDVEEFIDSRLKPDGNLLGTSIHKKLSHLREFYNTLEAKKAIAGNPVQEPFAEFRSNHDREPERPYIPFARMEYFINWLDHPFSRASWLLPLKDGIRKGEQINIDLRCCHIDHPVFWETVEQHSVTLDPRIRDKPDTILIYGGFNAGDKIPNEDTPGFNGDGEIRDNGNKRKQDDGSIIPIDSELKTALIEWLLVRQPTHQRDIHPLFTIGGSNRVRRVTDSTAATRLWRGDSFPDSIQNFAEEESLNDCPTCGEAVVEEILDAGEKTGRRFQCVNCQEIHWRSIYWDENLQTEEKFTHHQCRHYFSSAHSPENSGLHDRAIPDAIRKKEVRGDSNQQGDTEDKVYIEGQYKDFETDVRKPYLDGIYKFGVYDDLIPAVGEGWQR
jgi:sarcosine oxidase delta subunit